MIRWLGCSYAGYLIDKILSRDICVNLGISRISGVYGCYNGRGYVESVTRQIVTVQLSISPPNLEDYRENNNNPFRKVYSYKQMVVCIRFRLDTQNVVVNVRVYSSRNPLGCSFLSVGRDMFIGFSRSRRPMVLVVDMIILIV